MSVYFSFKILMRSLFYTIIKVIIRYFIKITQRTNIKLRIIEF